LLEGEIIVSQKIVEVEGIGPAYSEKLAGAGVATLEDLLNHGSTSKGRKELADKTGISEKLVLGWVNRADLARVSGIGGEYADLLELAGVDSVPELAQRNAANLHEKMVQVNAEKNAVRQVPSLKQVEDWVGQAKNLPRVVTH
jgi:predicted flap endonuclease-1-like 5' DNA nuclease